VLISVVALVPLTLTSASGTLFETTSNP
jgi:hypothetical protein